MALIKCIFKDAFGVPGPVRSIPDHLSGAMEWLCRAQDAAGGGGGVARSYSLRRHRFFKKKGWMAAYPETTGYIIPTFFNYADLTRKEEFRQRAVRMARWESEVQMPSGAVQGGTVDFPPSPAVFNTGQVLFGWSRAYRETGEPGFLESARRAADFLCDAQDPDGAWRRAGSRYARPGVNVYDARSAWGLLEAYKVTRDLRHRESAVRNFDFALSRQQGNGWFAECCLDDDKRPLLHTLAYTMEGLLEGGLALGEDRLIRAARLAAEALLARHRPDGSLAGQYDAAWNRAARWRCLTGEAQTALVWLRFYQITGEKKFLAAGKSLNACLMRTQDLDAANPGIRGGIKGAQPIWGKYGEFEFLNWAAKFFAEALLLELTIDRGGILP